MSKIRDSNIELLRIICMCFVIGGHLILSYSNDPVGCTEYYIGNFLRSFFVAAVNCYIIISGYFRIKLNVKKLIKIDLELLFYTLIIYFITVLFDIHSFDLKKDVLLLFPLVTKQYWFITIYFVLCLFSPFLNLLIDNLNKKQYLCILSLILMIFYCLPTLSYIFNSRTITQDSGYGLINFICLYFIGAYIQLYYNKKIKTYYYFIGFIISSMVLFFFNNLFTIVFGYYFDSFVSYDTIFTLISAIMLFMTFKNMQMKSIMINSISKYALSVYIIHYHPTFSNYLFCNVINVNNVKGMDYFLLILLCPFIIYLVCSFIEYLRGYFFNDLEQKIIVLLMKVFKKSK